MTYIGIDPGLHGAVAIITELSLIKLIDTPITVTKKSGKNKSEYIIPEMVRILKNHNYESVRVAIEKVHAMPKQGVSSMFNMGKGYGLWLGIIAALGMPYDEITPQAWKKHMMDGMGKEKSASCLRAAQLYPEAELFTPRGRALDGRGDALLIAEHVKRLNQPE